PASSDPVSLQIDPVVDANPPTIASLCGLTNAVYPVGYDARLRVLAKAPNATNALRGVDFAITVNGAITNATAALVAGVADTYELVYRIPDVADGSVINVQATAVTASGTTAMLTSNVIVVKNGVAIAADRTIAANDLS